MKFTIQELSPSGAWVDVSETDLGEINSRPNEWSIAAHARGVAYKLAAAGYPGPLRVARPGAKRAVHMFTQHQCEDIRNALLFQKNPIETGPGDDLIDKVSEARR